MVIFSYFSEMKSAFKTFFKFYYYFSQPIYTAICVTHDVDEAILMADRVVMMTNGPNARIGKVLHVDIPRPRTRRALLEHPRYYEYRAEVLDFLDEYETGAHAKKVS